MRPIDADGLLKHVWDADTRVGYVQVVDVGSIEEMPTLDVEPVRHAKWKHNDGIYDTCTGCNEEVYQAFPMNYCPLCGAKLDLED